MAQQRTIKFASVTTVNSLNELTVNSFSTLNYPDSGSTPIEKQDEPDIYKAEITEEVKRENSVESQEGLLLIALDEELINIDIDINGNLLILHPQSTNFSINADGELEYTFN